MSGGKFGYDQYRIEDMAVQIEEVVRTNGDEVVDEWGSYLRPEYSPEVIANFVEGVRQLRIAAAYVQRIDWLLSGDDGEESFLRRLEEDLERVGLESTFES